MQRDGPLVHGVDVAIRTLGKEGFRIGALIASRRKLLNTKGLSGRVSGKMGVPLFLVPNSVTDVKMHQNRIRMVIYLCGFGVNYNRSTNNCNGSFRELQLEPQIIRPAMMETQCSPNSSFKL